MLSTFWNYGKKHGKKPVFSVDDILRLRVKLIDDRPPFAHSHKTQIS